MFVVLLDCVHGTVWLQDELQGHIDITSANVVQVGLSLLLAAPSVPWLLPSPYFKGSRSSPRPPPLY